MLCIFIIQEELLPHTEHPNILLIPTEQSLQVELYIKEAENIIHCTCSEY